MFLSICGLIISMFDFLAPGLRLDSFSVYVKVMMRLIIIVMRGPSPKGESYNQTFYDEDQ